jgi:hypothetical protein
MSKYRELRLNQPKLTIKEGARELFSKQYHVCVIMLVI